MNLEHHGLGMGWKMFERVRGVCLCTLAPAQPSGEALLHHLAAKTSTSDATYQHSFT